MDDEVEGAEGAENITNIRESRAWRTKMLSEVLELEETPMMQLSNAIEVYLSASDNNDDTAAGEADLLDAFRFIAWAIFYNGMQRDGDAEQIVAKLEGLLAEAKKEAAEFCDGLIE